MLFFRNVIYLYRVRTKAFVMAKRGFMTELVQLLGAL